MKHTDLPLIFALCLTAATGAHAQDSLTPTSAYSSEFNYYGENQPFAHPVPPTLSTVPPRSYIPTPPPDFIPIASQGQASHGGGGSGGNSGNSGNSGNGHSGNDHGSGHSGNAASSGRNGTHAEPGDDHGVHRSGEIGDDHGVHVGGEPGDDKRS